MGTVSQLALSNLHPKEQVLWFACKYIIYRCILYIYTYLHRKVYSNMCMQTLDMYLIIYPEHLQQVTWCLPTAVETKTIGNEFINIK